jgi:hypothetical protein
MKIKLNALKTISDAKPAYDKGPAKVIITGIQVPLNQVIHVVWNVLVAAGLFGFVITLIFVWAKEVFGK